MPLGREEEVILHSNVQGHIKVQFLPRGRGEAKVWLTQTSRHFIQIGQWGPTVQLVISKKKSGNLRVCVWPIIGKLGGHHCNKLFPGIPKDRGDFLALTVFQEEAVFQA